MVPDNFRVVSELQKLWGWSSFPLSPLPVVSLPVLHHGFQNVGSVARQDEIKSIDIIPMHICLFYLFTFAGVRSPSWS